MERVNRTVQSLLRRVLLGAPADTWWHYLPAIQLALNSTVSRSTGLPTYLLMYGSMPYTPSLSVAAPPALSAEPSTAELAAFRSNLQGRME